MKKMFLMLAVLALVSAAFAVDVTISCTANNSTKEVTVNYASTSMAVKPRGMALNIALSAGTIVSVTKNTSNNYWVYPGSIDVEDPCQYNGTPVAVVAGTGIGYGSMIIEMGSLHTPTDTSAGPAQNGEVIKFVVSTAPCTITISGNAVRGGVVKYDAAPADVTYTGCIVELDDCLKNTAPEYAVWASTTWNKPNCWCYKRNCRGDADGIKSGPAWVSTPDLNILKAAFGKNDTALVLIPNGICADFDRTKTGPARVSTPDLTILKTYFGKGETTVKCCDLNQDCVIEAGDKFNFWKN